VFDYWIVSSYGTYGPFSGNSSNFPSSCGNPIGIPCGGTGAITAAGANLNITGVTQTGTLGTSSQVSTFPGTVAAGTIVLTPTSYTPFAQTIFSTGPFMASASLINSATSTVLGIGNPSYSQGYALHSVIGNFLHGGAYATQQSNVLSDFYGTQLVRTGGTAQLNAYYQVCLGIGDCIDHSGTTYGASGSGNQSGGISVPALQFAQPVLGIWPYVFKATLTSGASASGVFTYTPTQDEGPGAGARTTWDLSRTVNTGTATFALPNTVTFSGATDMAALNPVGWLLVLGSNAQGYAPSYNGQAGGATGTFTSFANPGAIYTVSAPTGTGATGYLVGNPLTIVQGGCTGAVVTVVAIDGSGQPTQYNPNTPPTGSGCAVASNLATTGGAGTGALVNITAITGVVGATGSSCRVTGFTGGTGATGVGSGGLVLLLSGTNAIAGGTPFTGVSAAAILPGFNNLVNSTGAVISSGTAQCFGNVVLNATSGPCVGDDIIIDGACWGHPQRISAINSSTQVEVENSYDTRLLAANTASTAFTLIPAIPATDIDIVAHNFTALGRFYQATSTAGSSITPGTYLLNGTGGLGSGLTCSTPPTTPTSGNLQCAQIEVIIGQAGTVSQIVPTVAGPPSYTSPPTFTMTGSSLNLTGGTAGCGGTCPVFTAYLDTNALAQFQSGDIIAQPPDHRMSESIIQGLEGAGASYLDQSGGYVAKNIGNGRNFSAYTIQGNGAPNYTGGYKYGLNVVNANLDYLFDTNSASLKSMTQALATKFSDWIWNWNGASAVGGTNYAGATFTSLAAGGAQPSALPAILLKDTQSICFAAPYTGSCHGGITGSPNSAVTFLSGITAGTPILSGPPALYSLVATDNVNNAFWTINSATGLDIGALFAASTGGTFHVWTAPAGVLTDLATAHTRFSAGVKIGATATELTSTDNNGSQVVTIAPAGTIAPAELPTATTSALGAVKVDGTTITISGGTISAGGTAPAPTMANCIAGLLPKPCKAAEIASTTYSGASGLTTVTGVSSGSGFSGSGTIFLTAFNNSCTGSTATVTLSSGAFASAAITAAGTGCTAAPTSATCTSGTATCTGSPVSITVTSTSTVLSPGTVTLLTPAAAGSYRQCGFLSMTVAATTGTTVYLNPLFFNDGHSNTGDVMASTASPATQWAHASGCTDFYADSAQPIRVGLQFNAVTGTPTVRYWVTLEWLQ
jgi:hypothetical protein